MIAEQTKDFFSSNIEQALQSCLSKNYHPLFMSELADRRISALGEDRAWNHWYATPSIRATGRTKQGTPVVLYVHKDSYLSNPSKIKETKDKKNIINGAGILPQEEFYRLLDLDGKKENGVQTVFCIDNDTLSHSISGIISIDQALHHPQTIPFLGGEERAQRYFEHHQEIYGDKVAVLHCNDICDQPVARLLFLNRPCGGLNSLNNLINAGRFFCVRAPEIKEKIDLPGLEEVLRILRPYTGTKILPNIETELKELWVARQK